MLSALKFLLTRSTMHISIIYYMCMNNGRLHSSKQEPVQTEPSHRHKQWRESTCSTSDLHLTFVLSADLCLSQPMCRRSLRHHSHIVNGRHRKSTCNAKARGFITNNLSSTFWTEFIQLGDYFKANNTLIIVRLTNTITITQLLLS